MDKSELTIVTNQVEYVAQVPLKWEFLASGHFKSNKVKFDAGGLFEVHKMVKSSI